VRYVEMQEAIALTVNELRAVPRDVQDHVGAARAKGTNLGAHPAIVPGPRQSLPAVVAVSKGTSVHATPVILVAAPAPGQRRQLR
jgi:hypothetical protein